MKIDILTLFPKMFDGPLSESILWRAKDKGFVEINIHDLRQWGLTERKTVDGKTYGGGVGMVLRVDILDKAISSLKTKNSRVILLDAGGKKYTQKKASQLSQEKHLIFVCGRYEGVDHRVHEHLVDEIISIGDYVLTGGEIPAMVITDSIVRLIPGVLKKEEATQIESHSKPGYIEYPQYTRPEVYKKWPVPKVLLSGNHKEIQNWRNSK
ncbi:MAG: tRNA (guanosine(37)-N1)-methyltransferase TrmD [Patescibacteria group bacterium]|mgnify:CR=1 FL=1